MSEQSTIVLIDPTSDTDRSLANRLAMQGYGVALVHEPAEGARIALADPPAAVIADLWMPRISGVQLCRLLKAEPATEHVPVILRGPDSPRNHFWSERAGASAYVAKGRMGDLVRALREAIAEAPQSAGFFTSFAGEDIRERIAVHLDAALFESVISAELRALGTCGAFDRLFDLFSQFLSRVASYRWVAISTQEPARLGIHTNPRGRALAEQEARRALEVGEDALLVLVEDDDASHAAPGPPPIVQPIELAGIPVGKLAVSLLDEEAHKDEGLVSVIARELAGPIRMATLVEEAQRLATVDSLTGLMNRRAFVGALEREIAVASRYGHSLSLVLLDVDHFKSINDRLGHGVGDTVLATLGRHLQKQVRTTDFAARWGGEEFVVALSSTDLDGASVFAERLRRTIEGLVIVDGTEQRVPITASIGVATHCSGERTDTLVDRADRAMYAAKTAGRNRVGGGVTGVTAVAEATRAPEATRAS